MKNKTIVLIQKNLPVVLSLILLFPIFQNCSKLNSTFSATSDKINSSFSFDLYAPQSIAGPQNISNGLVTLKEYHHKPLNKFFYTSRINDQIALESANLAQIFEVTGNTFTISAADSSGYSPLYRLFNATDVYHNYTLDLNAYNNLLSNPGWKSEGVEGFAILINPGAACPTSPFVTYPVYRLYHSEYKYRLAIGLSQKQQLITNGYLDQGIAICAHAVNSVAPVAEPPESQSCSLNGINVAHGTAMTAYQASSVQAGQNCISQSRSCSNGTLSGSYPYTSCQVVVTTPPPTGTVCLSIPGFLQSDPFTSSSVYRKTYSTSTLSDRSHDTYRMKGTSTVWSIPLVISATDSTAGSVLASLSFAEAPSSQRAGKKVVISRSRCDMTSASNIVLTERSNTSSYSLSINDSTRATTGTMAPKALNTGNYYINIQNVSCTPTQYCDSLVQWLGVSQ